MTIERTLLRAATAGCLALALVAHANRAHAQANGSEDATRRDLILRAQTAAEAGHHADALDLALRAGQIRMSPPLRRLIAEEQEANQHFAEALAAAQACVQENQADASIPNRRAHVTACSAIVTRVQQHVGRVTVRVSAPAPAGLTVRVGGADLAAPLWGVPYVVGSGTVAVEASAEGYAAFHQDVEVTPGGSSEVMVSLSRAGAQPVATAASPAAAATPAASSDGSAGGGPPWVPLAVVAGVLGVGGLAAGVVGNVMQRDAGTRFNGGNCFVQNGMPVGGDGTVDCAGAYSQGQSMQTVALVGYIAGGVLVAAAVGMFAASRLGGSSEHPPRAQALCVPSVTQLGVECAVRF